MNRRTLIRARQTHGCGWHRAGAASLELVMVTAVALPLVLMMFFIAVRMCAFVYQALGGTLLMPFA